jgi:hypothetical protein
LGNPDDYLRAFKEVHGKYIGSRPIRLKKSDWKSRGFKQGKKKEVNVLL